MSARAAPADERVVDPDAVGGVVLGHVDHLVVHLRVGADGGQHLARGRRLGGDAQRVLVGQADRGRQVLQGVQDSRSGSLFSNVL